MTVLLQQSKHNQPTLGVNTCYRVAAFKWEHRIATRTQERFVHTTAVICSEWLLSRSICLSLSGMRTIGCERQGQLLKQILGAWRLPTKQGASAIRHITPSVGCQNLLIF